MPRGTGKGFEHSTAYRRGAPAVSSTRVAVEAAASSFDDKRHCVQGVQQPSRYTLHIRITEHKLPRIYVAHTGFISTAGGKWVDFPYI